MKTSWCEIGYQHARVPNPTVNFIEMKYIINKFVVFDTDKRIVYLYENNQIVTRVTKPATRLLLEFIQSNGVSISRDNLLERVWLAYGYSASNAGLNNYISELRKAFAALGCHQELITTLPKLGFKFEAEIDLLDAVMDTPEGSQSPEEPLTLKDIDESEETSTEMLPASNVDASPHRKKLYALSGFILFIVVIGFTILLINRQKSYDIKKIARIEQCELYVLDKTPLVDNFFETISAKLKQEAVDCKKIPSDVFYHEDRIGKNIVRADLISVCSKVNNNRYDSCFNIKNQRNTSK